MDNVYNVCKATIKLDLNDGLGSGFFIKLERNNKEFYCIMTNEHVITKEHINKKEEILINYDNEKKFLIIKLDKKERIIESFKETLGLDITLVEILPKDKIDNSFFLTPNYNYTETYEEFINKDIEIVQYPKGNNLSLSKGKILKIFESNDYIFFHDADTENGSSGSPIVLKGEETVIALHRGSAKDKTKNIGIFIGIIVDVMKAYKKNGIRREYYKDGNLKYEGNFVDDEYDGDGEFHYENGEIYIGQFKEGKKNGDGYIFKDNNVIKNGKFENDEFIDQENCEFVFCECGFCKSLIRRKVFLEHLEKHNQEKSFFIFECTYCGSNENLRRCLCKKIICERCLEAQKNTECSKCCYIFKSGHNTTSTVYNLSKYPLPKIQKLNYISKK